MAKDKDVLETGRDFAEALLGKVWNNSPISKIVEGKNPLQAVQETVNNDAIGKVGSATIETVKNGAIAAVSAVSAASSEASNAKVKNPNEMTTREQYNADNGIREEQAASTPQKNPSSNAAVVTVEKPQNTATFATEQSQQQPKYTGVLLGVGNANEDVRKLQEKLVIDADGIYGKNTKAAVEKFQRENNLAVDGIVGEKTATALLTKGVNLNGVTGGKDVNAVTAQTLEDNTNKKSGNIVSI